jgi:hypothetical protein
MDDREMIADLLTALGTDVREMVEGRSLDDLAWRPDALGNSAGVTVWHFARWLDVLTARVLADGPASAERWHADGWAARTGYDPTGIGYKGLGVVTGYTAEDVDAIPNLPAADLLAYLDRTIADLRSAVLAYPPGGLSASVPGIGAPRSVYSAVKPILFGSIGHAGEIAALNGLRERSAVGVVTG